MHLHNIIITIIGGFDLLFNTILLILFFSSTPKSMGTYKYFVLVYALVDILDAIAHTGVLPVSFPFSTSLPSKKEVV